MKKNSRKPESFIINPVYPGGNKALNDFITSNMKYPEEALKNKIEGSVSIEYDIDVFGKVIATRVMHGIGYGCDEEACRLVSLLKFPKHKYKGLHVVFHMKINIHFKMHEASKPIPQQQNLVYNYVEKKKTEKPQQGKPQQGYTIKINTGKGTN
jgi:TonB family protein